ncbi:hypothetical protein CkaCkLH20_03719 [Colletotrichum karsti]|uniref:Uncharacterized protein n=1 Tax=Colletotrichum karsti TaxID=1095194 RepID=A0A9P6LJX7_9PEZI|nr:uncharacterized protein CkaCkLH20_03719 [Colletotrichum karsti]KAF9878819.1 hypothetical protein CkaCkLH20_03719 [Colletotrichum karsti]
MLAVGSSFYTSNLGFQYTVKKINIPGNDTHVASTLPAIGYKNTTLDNCRVSELKLLLARSPNSGANSWWFSFKRSTVATTLRCTVVYDSGVADVTLGAEYFGSVSTYEYIIDDNYNKSASVWWGTRLSNAYFTGVLAAAAQATLPPDRFINDAELTYTENELVKDLHSEDFFKLNWNFGLADAKVYHLGMDGADKVVVYNNGKFWGSPSITEGLHFAKIMHSVFALDLGNCDAPNLLLDNEGLKYAVLAPDDNFRDEGALLNNTSTFEAKDGGRYSNIPSPGDDFKFTRLYDAYKTFPSQMGELSCRNATIVAQYLCSVPQPKSPGVMILAIIIADLVFLQAAWKLMQWISGRMLNQPDAMICEGVVNTPRPIRSHFFG